MARYEIGQKVWVQGIVTKLDEPDILDVKVEFEQGNGNQDILWISSKCSHLMNETPLEPKQYIPVRLFGYTIFDLWNTIEIGKIWELSNQQQWCIDLKISRGGKNEILHFCFKTQEEAVAARNLIEKEVLKAKGIDDDNKRINL